MTVSMSLCCQEIRTDRNLAMLSMLRYICLHRFACKTSRLANTEALHSLMNPRL